jgi:hypothetical protein
MFNNMSYSGNFGNNGFLDLFNSFLGLFGNCFDDILSSLSGGLDSMNNFVGSISDSSFDYSFLISKDLFDMFN